jgi:hypothetical protein
MGRFRMAFDAMSPIMTMKPAKTTNSQAFLGGVAGWGGAGARRGSPHSGQNLKFSAGWYPQRRQGEGLAVSPLFIIFLYPARIA